MFNKPCVPFVVFFVCLRSILWLIIVVFCVVFFVHYNDEPQDRAKTNKANKKHHTKHYNDEPQDRA
jgi:uncharacterized membrane protein